MRPVIFARIFNLQTYLGNCFFWCPCRVGDHMQGERAQLTGRISIPLGSESPYTVVKTFKTNTIFPYGQAFERSY